MAHDIFLDPNGHIVHEDQDAHVATGREATRHRLRLVLMWHLEEWRGNPSIGIPYREVLGVKPPDLDLLRSEVVRNVEADPAVIRTGEFDLAFDRENRAVSIEGSALTVDDEEVVLAQEVTL